MPSLQVNNNAIRHDTYSTQLLVYRDTYIQSSKAAVKRYIEAYYTTLTTCIKSKYTPVKCH